MTSKFEDAVKRVSLDKGYSDNEATMQLLLERRSDGAYCVDWVGGMHLGWIARGAADSEAPRHAEWHQFTRGEWLVDRDEKMICIEQEGQAFMIADIGSIDVLEPATQSLNAKFFFGPESVANAYLLRSAPQMLRALESVMKWGKAMKPGDSATFDEVQKAINAALMRLPGCAIYTDIDEIEAV